MSGQKWKRRRERRQAQDFTFYAAAKCYHPGQTHIFLPDNLVSGRNQATDIGHQFRTPALCDRYQ